MSAQYLNPVLASAEPAAGQLEAQFVLTGDEARHAVKVARVTVGENIVIFDGKGLQHFGTVTETGLDADQKTFLTYRLDRQRLTPEPKLKTILVQSLAKGGRDELAAQTATELGVWAVMPWQSERSVSRWDTKKAARNRDRWQQIVIDAAKQSLNPFVPEVLNPAIGAAAFSAFSDYEHCTLLMLDPASEHNIADIVAEITSEISGTLVLFIGPEGGFSAKELATIAQHGGQTARMGHLVLRSSSAGPAALALINQLSGAWD